MYTGTLIEDLIATVERAEEHASTTSEVRELEHWFALSPQQNQLQRNLLGVA